MIATREEPWTPSKPSCNTCVEATLVTQPCAFSEGREGERRGQRVELSVLSSMCKFQFQAFCLLLRLTRNAARSERDLGEIHRIFGWDLRRYGVSCRRYLWFWSMKIPLWNVCNVQRCRCMLLRTRVARDLFSKLKITCVHRCHYFPSTERKPVLSCSHAQRSLARFRVKSSRERMRLFPHLVMFFSANVESLSSIVKAGTNKERKNALLEKLDYFWFRG